MPTIAFGDWAPRIEKRITMLEEKCNTLIALNSELEQTVTELRSAFSEQITELFSQLEASRELLDNLTDVINEPEDDEEPSEEFDTLELEAPQNEEVQQ